MNKFHIDLERIIKVALDELYRKDIYLITHEPTDLSNGGDAHVSERGIVARFLIYLERLRLKNCHLKGYNLDVEYNRNLDEPKYLPGTIWKNNGAFPDMVLHIRGNNDGNILIVEFKTHWNKGREGIISDIVKLQAFLRDPYFYENALFVMLNRDSPKLFWIKEDSDVEEIVRSVQ